MKSIFPVVAALLFLGGFSIGVTPIEDQTLGAVSLFPFDLNGGS